MHGKRPPDNQMSPPLDLVSGPCSLFQIGICRYVQLLVHVRVSSLVLCKPWHIGEPSMLCLAWLTFLDIRVFLLPASSQNLLCCDFVLLHPWIGLLYDRLGSFLRVLGSPLSGHLVPHPWGWMILGFVYVRVICDLRVCVCQYDMWCKNIVKSAWFKVFRIRSQFISLHVLQI